MSKRRGEQEDRVKQVEQRCLQFLQFFCTLWEASRNHRDTVGA